MLLTEQTVLQTLMAWRSRVSAAAWVVVRNSHAAEDIFQNVVIKAMTREVSFESESSLLSWAFITARREGLDWLARNRRQIAVLDADLMDLLEHDWKSRPIQQAGAKIDALQDCLETAPENSRMLLSLRYSDGLPCEEVAEKMGVGLNAVYKRLSRLHESLRQCIEGKIELSSNVQGFAK